MNFSVALEVLSLNMSKLVIALVMHVSAYPYQQKFRQLTFRVLWASSFLPQIDVLTWEKTSFYPRQDFFYPKFVFLYDLTLKEMK